MLNACTLSGSISFLGCALQLFPVVLLAGWEMGILLAMSTTATGHLPPSALGGCHEQRFLHPADGPVVGQRRGLGSLVLGREFCGSNRVPPFCDVPALLTLTCSAEHITMEAGMAVGVCYAFSCLVCSVAAHVHILSTVLKIPSRQSQAKAFSTCMPHLVVVSVFLGTGTVAYLRLTGPLF